MASERTELELEPGTIVAGRYRIESPLGEGGMARVYRAVDLDNHDSVALKVLKANLAADQQAVERFLREGEILEHLKHPVIVSIRGTGGVGEGSIYIAMELLEGETLGARMVRGRLDPDELTPVITGVAVGLHAAHEAGVIHRDLKPDNIFLTYPRWGGPLQVKIMDFGISKLAGSDRITHTGQILGTPRYMAPEQLMADRDLDQRVDVYALGAILYQALSGRPPFAADRPTQLVMAILKGDLIPLSAYRPDLPQDISDVVMRAMALDRNERFGDALQLANAWIDALKPYRPHRTAITEGRGPREPSDGDT